MVANGYQEGDTWYRDMRMPGFNGDTAPEGEDSLRWLAQQIVEDRRFAEATVRFWWPSIMGSEIAEAPEAEDDADFQGLLLAANAQSAEVRRLARGFRRGFHDGKAYNLRDFWSRSCCRSGSGPMPWTMRTRYVSWRCGMPAPDGC